LREHIVRNYDTVERLSAQYRIPVCMIVRANGFDEHSVLKRNQRVRIPPPCYCMKLDAEDQEECEDCIRYEHKKYVVQECDTVYSISQKYKTTMDCLLRANGMAHPDELEPGQVISVPCVGDGFLIYSVHMTDSISGIAERFHLEEQVIKNYNNITDKNGIYPGMQLVIPLE